MPELRFEHGTNMAADLARSVLSQIVSRQYGPILL
jgi:hypothetical protein